MDCLIIMLNLQVILPDGQLYLTKLLLSRLRIVLNVTREAG